jgi:F-type H+-transporting ATPase subunit b
MANSTVAKTEAHGGAAHGPKPKALGMDATMWVAVAMLFVIGLAIWKKVPAMIAAALDKQIDGIRENIVAAEQLRKDAEGLKAEYEAKARQAEADAEAMKVAAEADAKAIVAKAKADATALIARRTKSAEDKIAAAERAAIADVRNRAAEAATAAAAMLIAERHDAGSDKALVEAAISRLN